MVGKLNIFQQNTVAPHSSRHNVKPGTIGQKTNGYFAANTIARMQTILTHTIVFLICLLMSIFYEGPSSEALPWFIIIWTFIIKITREINKVYGCFGMFRSPFYTACGKLQKGPTLVMKFLLRLVHPVVTGLILHWYIISLNQDVPDGGQMTSKFSFLQLVATQRIFRWIWQNTDSAAIEVSIHFILKVGNMVIR